MAGLSIGNRFSPSTGLSIGGGLSTGSGLYFGGFAFSPASLFAQGEQGVWYDPSDMTTLFQDSAGTTPVTAVEQPVGRMLDKSGRGNHATQATSASRPVLSARYNLLTKTEQFDDAVWVKTGATVTANAAVAPDGTTTAARIITTTGSAFSSRILQNGPAAPGALMSFSVWMWCASGTQRVTLAITQVGVINSYSSYIVVNSTPTLYTFQHQFTSGTGASDVRVTTGADGIGFDIFVWHPEFRATNDGVGIPTYQRVNTSTDYDTVGFPPYLRFDGVDDSMATASINFTSTDKMTVFAGVRKLSDASLNMIYEFGATGNDAGSFDCFVNAGPYQFGTNGLGNAQVTYNAGAAPLTNVISTKLDNALAAVATNAITLRFNALDVIEVSSTNGAAGNYGNYPFYIGARTNSALRFNGRIYSLIVRGAATDAAQITDTEQWISNEMGGGYYPTGYDFLVDANGDQITDASGNPLFTQALYT